MYAIKTTQLTKKYSKHTVVDGVSLAVKQGQIYGLLGPNGSGKSTVINMLLGLESSSQGEIELFGEIVQGYNPSQFKHIGAVLEGSGLYRDLTAQANLQILCQLCQVPLSRISEVLEFIGLAKVGDKKVSQFSLGMKQRLAIGAALLAKPKLIILDEPTNGLDALVISELKQFIKRLPQLGVTVLITCHTLADIDELCDEVGLLKQGKLVYQGCKQQFKQGYGQRLLVKVSDLARAKQLLAAEFVTGFAVEPATELTVVSQVDAASTISNQTNTDAGEGVGIKAEIEIVEQDGCLLLNNINQTMAAQVNRLLVNAGIDVFQLTRQVDSLEQAFMRRL